MAGKRPCLRRRPFPAPFFFSLLCTLLQPRAKSAEHGETPSAYLKLMCPPAALWKGAGQSGGEGARKRLLILDCTLSPLSLSLRCGFSFVLRSARAVLSILQEGECRRPRTSAGVACYPRRDTQLALARFWCCPLPRSTLKRRPTALVYAGGSVRA